jgi:hypothetical protein
MPSRGATLGRLSKMTLPPIYFALAKAASCSAIALFTPRSRPSQNSAIALYSNFHSFIASSSGVPLRTSAAIVSLRVINAAFWSYRHAVNSFSEKSIDFLISAALLSQYSRGSNNFQANDVMSSAIAINKTQSTIAKPHTKWRRFDSIIFGLTPRKYKRYAVYRSPDASGVGTYHPRNLQAHSPQILRIGHFSCPNYVYLVMAGRVEPPSGGPVSCRPVVITPHDPSPIAAYHPAETAPSSTTGVRHG